MSKYTEQEIREKLEQLKSGGDWNHLFNFPGNIRTIEASKVSLSPGFSVIKWKKIEPIINALAPEGKTMLDVGCSDGYFSIMCAEKNMLNVCGIDPDSDRIEKAIFAKDVYEIKNIEFKEYDLYKIDNNFPKFDIVLGLGLIHRVPDLELCLQKLALVGKNIILEFKYLDDNTSYDWHYHQGRTKSNKWNGLYYVPTKKYVINLHE